jgi:DNA repair exonuclease SbcCD nuclease subunit
MKVAVITDQHFGARKNSKLFHDYFLKFYNEVFFPTLEVQNITCVIDMGDTFDSRKGIDFSALSWAKKNYYDRLRKMGIKVYTVVGNHTAYYKNTNDVNAIELLLREYDNIIPVSNFKEVKVGGLDISLIAWITEDTKTEVLKKISKSKSKVAFGHLELQGFKANHGIWMEHGMDRSVFSRYDKVFTGHYHHRSNQANVHYLGNPYEMYWNDAGDVRGFHIFDTETLEHTPVNNPFHIFHTVYYEDTPYQLFDATECSGKILKVVVRKKTDDIAFEKFIDKIFSANPAELKIVENFNVIENDDFEAFESEDTLAILSRYIEESDTQVDKSAVKNLVSLIYKEACEVE